MKGVRSLGQWLLAGAACLPAAAAADDAYVDRVLEAGAQQDDGDPQPEPDTAGLTRNVRVEYSLAAQNPGGPAWGAGTQRVQGLTLGGFLQTVDYGALSMEASATRYQGANAGDLRAPLLWWLDQRAMPLTGGWLANHSAGNINTPLPALAQGLGRVFVPRLPIAGLAGSWTHADDFMVNASTGRSGFFSSGIDANGFELSPGRIASTGLQWGRREGVVPDGRIDVAAQWLRATQVPSLATGLRTDTDGAWGSVSWQGLAPWAQEIRGLGTSPVYERSGGMRVQAHWLRSRDADASAQGLWADAAWRTEWLRNLAGVYRFDPGLRWGTLFMPGNLQGAYWRADVNTQRWQAGWLVEADATVSGPSRRDAFWNVYGRRRISSATAIGGGVTVRTGLAAGRQLDVNWDQQTDFGQTLARVRLLRTPRSDFTAFAVDHTWPLEPPLALSTTLTQERQQGLDGSGRRLIWGVLGSYTGARGARIDASLRGAHGNGMQALSVNLAAAWQLRHDWTLAARAYVSRGQEPQLTALSSALAQATAGPLNNAVNMRGIQFVLRHEWRAGHTPAPLGGVPGSGAGAVRGVIFLDANANGRRDAAEAGVANVAVVLDGHFVARTDSQGRFEFPAVVAGRHTLQIEPDNVPLPWSPVQRERVDVDVPVRGSATLDFPLRRDDGRT